MSTQPLSPDGRDRTGARPAADVYAEQRAEFAREVAQALANTASGQVSAMLFLDQGGPGSTAGSSVVGAGPADA